MRGYGWGGRVGVGSSGGIENLCTLLVDGRAQGGVESRGRGSYVSNSEYLKPG